MNKRTKTTLKGFLLEQYAVLRTIRESTLNAMRISVDNIDRWNGRPTTLDQLTDEFVSKWVADLEKQGKLAPKTRYGKRADILTLWRAAHRLRLAKEPPLYVRGVKVPRLNPTAWTADELDRILTAAKGLTGTITGNGLPRALYFHTVLKAGYETGLRREDLLQLRADAVQDDGLVTITMEKTQLPHVCQIRPDTLQGFRRLQAILEVHEDPNAFRPLWWPHEKRGFYHWLEKIAAAAAVEAVGMQKMRRTGATHLESIVPNAAARFLGHSSPMVAMRHYVDRSLLRSTLIPPEPEPSAVHFREGRTA